jgi:hypothetical protein
LLHDSGKEDVEFLKAISEKFKEQLSAFFTSQKEQN